MTGCGGTDPSWVRRCAALFLSRVHPKKGLPYLLRAWASLGCRHGDWVLVHVGPDQVGHTAEIRSLAEELGILHRVIFAGPLYGLQKVAVMGRSSLFVLPSFSEGFSVAVLEAAACELPVLLSPQCNFPEMVSAGGGLEAAPTAAATAEGLEALMGLSDLERASMGRRARSFVETHYTWPTVAANMIEVYAWLVGGGACPSFVEKV